MTTPEVLQIAQVLVTVIAGIGIPILIWRSNKQDEDRTALREEIHHRYDHLDGCIDDLKVKVLGEAATRADIAAMRSEHNALLVSMRASISNETHGLHQRIMRIEDRILGHASADD